MSNSKKDRVMRIYKRFFIMLKEGTKTIEIRVAYPGMKKIKAGVVIRFNNDYSCRMLVIRVAKYENFDDMFQNEDAGKINPYQSVKEQLREIRQIFPTNKEKIGVIAFEMKKI